MSTTINASALLPNIKLTLAAGTGYLGLNQIDPQAMIHTEEGQILVANQSGEALVVSFPAGEHAYIAFRDGGELSSTRAGYMGVPFNGSNEMHFYNEQGGDIRIQADTSGDIIVRSPGGSIELEPENVAGRNIQLKNRVDCLDATVQSATMTFGPSGSGTQVAITPVLDPDATCYFWFGYPSQYLYIDVESGPGTGTYLATHRERFNGATPQAYGGVLVPAGCRVRVFIDTAGPFTYRWRKFGI